MGVFRSVCIGMCTEEIFIQKLADYLIPQPKE